MKSKFLIPSHRLYALLPPALGALAAALVVQATFMPDVIRKAGKIPNTFEGLDKFLDACSDLQTMSLVAFVGLVPIAVFVGLGMMAFGGKNAVQKVGLPVAALLGILIVPGVIA